MVRCLLCVIVLGSSLSPVSAQTLPRAIALLDAASTVQFGEAYGVVLVPGGRGANPQGVLMVRDGASWSEPEFVTLRTGAAETLDYVILFPTRQSLDRSSAGSGSLDSEAAAHARVRGAFVRVAFDRVSLRKSGVLSGAPDRKQAAELRAKLAERTAPKPAPEAIQTAMQLDWALLVAHPGILVGGFAALGAWLATMKKRRR